MTIKKIELTDLPYTVIGHTSVPLPILSISLTAQGIKKLAKRTKNSDVIRIEQWQDVNNECNSIKHYGRIIILREE